MHLLSLVFVLWLPVIIGIVGVVVALGLIVWYLRRRARVRLRDSGYLKWSAGAVVVCIVLIVGGAVPGIYLFIYWTLGSGDDIDAVSLRMTRLQSGCARLSIQQQTDFIAAQRPDYRHELEGRLLRRLFHCTRPQTDAPLPDTTRVFSAAERDSLRRIADSHRWRPAPDWSQRGEPYRPSWASDADAVDALLLWQERGLDAFDEIFDGPEQPEWRRKQYLGLAALDCLRSGFAGDCTRVMTPARIEALTHDSHPLLPWRPGLLEQLRAAARGNPGPVQHTP